MGRVVDMKKVLITGATGFVGGYVVDELLKAGHEVTALVRNPKKAAALERSGIALAQGDVLDPASIESAASGRDVLVHLVGIIREKPGAGFEQMHHQATVNAVRAAAACGMERFVHMSALGTRPHARSRYHQTKWKGEEAVRAAGIPFVIFRPSVIFGPGDEFISMLADFFKNPLFVPVIGAGKAKLQPVYAGDVARCFAAAVDNPDAANRIFELAGPARYTMPQLLDVIGEHLGRRRAKLHMPEALAKPMARAMEKLLPDPPLTTDQLTMIREDNTGDPAPAAEVFQMDFVRLESILPEYIN
jgi:NADH dehydrogenase